MALNFDLLRLVHETPGAPGYEQRIRQVVMNEVKSLVDELYTDNMGNVYAVKKGKERKKVMVAAHMDEISFIVNHIDENGFLRFHPLGGFDPKTLTAQRVIVHGAQDLIGVMGSKPIHVMSMEERAKTAKITDYFIDLGMKKEDVEKLVKPGDVVTRERSLIEMGECINGKSIDNRIAVYILIETLRRLKDVPYDVYAVFTVQEEIGVRGAQAATLSVQPDFGFGLDTTIAYDVPGSIAHEQVTKLGDGTAIKIMDSSVVCDYRMVAYMKEVANRHEIKWQPELLPAGGTDTSALQKMTAGGAITGCVSIPTRHIHQVIETAHKQDIEGSISLLTQCIQELNTYNWSF